MTDNAIIKGSDRLSPLESAELTLTENLPWVMMSLLERRYLNAFQSDRWDYYNINAESKHHPILQEITSLGHCFGSDKAIQAMPHVLNACNEPGHAMIMVIQGEGNSHRFFIGAKRLSGAGARSTDHYLNGEASAYKAYFTGLELKEPHVMNDNEMPELMSFIQTAPALATITGIPSLRGKNNAFEFQTIDHLVNAIGIQKYALMVVAEPLDPEKIDKTIDVCRKLKSEIHAYIRRTKSIVRGETQTQGTSTSEKDVVPSCIQSSLLFLNLLGRETAGIDVFDILSGVMAGLNILNMTSSKKENIAEQKSTSTSWQESGSLELFDANAEACENLLQKYIDRLTIGRSNGWWKTAVYIAAENSSVCQSVGTALRSIVSGDNTYLEPFRVIEAEPYILRPAMEQGNILQIRPKNQLINHPLGEAYDALGTCISSDELSLLLNLPQQELPGLPVKDREKFGLTIPEGNITESPIELGYLLDSQRRRLNPVTLFSNEINRHCFVSGATGYGKTNTCIQILLEAYEKWKTPFLVIEPAKAEYQRLNQVPVLENQLRVFHIGTGDNSHLPFRLNPFHIMPGVSLGRHIDLLKAVFNASFPMFAGMTYVLEEAILDVYKERGWSLYTSKNSYLSESASLEEISALTPCLEDLFDQIEVVMKRKKYGEETQQNMGAALRSRLHSLMLGNKGLALNTKRCLPMSQILQAPTIIELRNLGDDEEKSFVMALIFMFLYEFAETRQDALPDSEKEHLQHITLIEEAHRLLKAAPERINSEIGDPQAKAVTMFTDMLAEMRAYGEGFIIADQIPTKLAPETIKNSNIKIVHRLIAPDDRSIMGSCLNLKPIQTRTINNLEPGMAIVHDERLGEAVITKIHPAKEILPLANRAHTQEINSKLLADRFYYYRHGGCQNCDTPCKYYYTYEESERPHHDSFQSFAISLLLGNQNEFEYFWHSWVKNFDNSLKIRITSVERSGALFCAATQEMYDWLGNTILLRNQPQNMTPNDRLLQETAARLASPLLKSLVENRSESELNKVFAETHLCWAEKIFSAPSIELDGCRNCPQRCKLLSFANPINSKVRKTIESTLRDSSTAATKFEVFKKLEMQHMNQYSYRTVDEQFDKYSLYCLLVTTIQNSSDKPLLEEILKMIVE